MTRKTTFTLVIDVELLEKLEEISRKTGESISSLIRKAVESWLELEEKK
ncbi:MAG: ribbon-helix-helix domain-containing protein [Thermoproteota archaeon]